MISGSQTGHCALSFLESVTGHWKTFAEVDNGAGRANMHSCDIQWLQFNAVSG